MHPVYMALKDILGSIMWALCTLSDTLYSIIVNKHIHVIDWLNVNVLSQKMAVLSQKLQCVTVACKLELLYA